MDESVGICSARHPKISNPMKLTYTEDEKKRLDNYLNEELEDISRSQIQKMIKRGEFTVNDKQVSNHHFLKNGDVIKKVKITEQKNQSESKKKKSTKKLKPRVIAQTDKYAVLHKPAGLIMHGGENIDEYTLADWIQETYPDIHGIGEDEKRPGIVHRLDKNVSGILAIAKTQAMYDSLKAQFQEHTVLKEYTVLVHGEIEEPTGAIDFLISRSKNQKHRMAARPKSQDEGKEALTEYEVINRYFHNTLLHARIKTGRPHQIRVHFQALGYPVVGDTVYKLRGQKKLVDLGRIFLQSTKLGFHDSENNWVEFTSKLDKELSEYLKTLKEKN